MNPAAAHAIPQDLSGRSVLDIGCGDGLYAMETKRRGAARVVAIDTSEGNLALARETASARGAKIDFRRMAVYELGTIGERFDLVLFLGGLSHLRYPLLALDLIYEHAAADLLVVQTLLRGASVVHRLEEDYPFAQTAVFEYPGFPRLHFIEDRYAGDPTYWWIPNLACAEAMLRSAGFRIEEHPELDVFVCRRGERRGEVEEVLRWARD
jgi:tRNA (mo5U34)-methyltransferase